MSAWVHSLLVEGGASLAAALLEADLVDRVVLFQAPVLLGEGALAGVRPTCRRVDRWTRVAGGRFGSEWIGDDHMLVLAPQGH